MLNEMLHTYLHQQPSSKDVRQIKQWLDETADAEIEKALFEQWENHRAEEPRNWKAYHAVSDNLESFLQGNTAKPRHSRSFSISIARVAAILLLPLLFAGSVYYVTKQYDRQLYAATRYQLKTGRGERATLLLPDGTKVFLNSGSTFTYPASFGKIDRRVSLEGEAYFEVMPDENLPFLVQAKQTQIKVLGTVFNVHTCQEEDWIETALVEGKVEFYEISDPDNRITLLPDQTARFNTMTRQFERNVVEQRFATAWKRGEIIFCSASWPDIIEQISDYYGIVIEQADKKIPQEQFTGSFLHEDVNNVLRNLQIHYHFSYTKVGNLIKIKFE